ncbi:MAG: hypothetical protein GXO79_11100 [Chlorobi bacterium]|nr:hypothetical protein [Chlorobiota bacterium]
MLTQANVLKTITLFPEKFPIDELVDKMILPDKIGKGIKDTNRGKVLSEKKSDEKIAKWPK